MNMSRTKKKTAKYVFGWNLLFWSFYFIIASIVGTTPEFDGFFDAVTSGYPFLIVGTLGITGIVISINILFDA